jgi:hypothetical protein
LLLAHRALERGLEGFWLALQFRVAAEHVVDIDQAPSTTRSGRQVWQSIVLALRPTADQHPAGSYRLMAGSRTRRVSHRSVAREEVSGYLLVKRHGRKFARLPAGARRIRIRSATETPARLIIPIDLKPLKGTMPTTTPTILGQIIAEKTKISERLARLDTDRAAVATRLTDLETAERVLALATGRTQQELYLACPNDRPNLVGIAVQRHLRAGRIQERAGKLYATSPAT